MRINDFRIGGHDRPNLFGKGPHLEGIAADHPELDRKTDRRAEHKPIGARPSLGQGARGERLIEPRLDPFAPLQISGDDHDLREIRIRQHRVEAQPETRGALSDIGRVARDIRIMLQ